jgi:xanthine dehydrogenase accessory factor
VSGGCIEGAIAAEALATLARGTDRFLKLGEGSPFFDIVLPCGGGLTLSLHILRNREPLRFLVEQLSERKPASLIYDPRSQSLALAETVETGWRDDKFRRAYRPSQRIALGGIGVEAETLQTIATAAGYEVVPIDLADLDTDTAVVLLFHDLDREMPLLDAALAGRSRYIGALGSRRTHERRCEALRLRGHSEDNIARIRGPIGLFGPARDASTLALSILADIAR